MSTQAHIDQISAVADKPPEKPPEPEVFDEGQPAEPLRVRDRRGNVHDYEIREMDGKELSTWNLIWAKYAKHLFGTKIEGMDYTEPPPENVQVDLISRCLYENDQRVPRGMIERWGATLLTQVFTSCQRINGQTARAEKKEGKS